MTTDEPLGPADAEPDPDPEPEAPPRRGSGGRTVLIGLVLAVATVVGMAGATFLLERGNDAGGTADETVAAEGGLGPVSGAESDPLPEAELEVLGGGGAIEPTGYDVPVVVNFWATWCAPCVAEMPEFQEAYEGYDDRVAFLGVNLQDEAEGAIRFADELGITYDLAEDNGDYFAEVSGFGMPTTLLVDESGIVRYRHTGALDLDDLRGLVAEHLGVES